MGLLEALSEAFLMCEGYWDYDWIEEYQPQVANSGYEPNSEST